MFFRLRLRLYIYMPGTLNIRFFYWLAINWMMNPISTWEIVGNHLTSIHYRGLNFHLKNSSDPIGLNKSSKQASVGEKVRKKSLEPPIYIYLAKL